MPPRPLPSASAGASSSALIAAGQTDTAMQAVATRLQKLLVLSTSLSNQAISEMNEYMPMQAADPAHESDAAKKIRERTVQLAEAAMKAAANARLEAISTGTPALLRQAYEAELEAGLLHFKISSQKGNLSLSPSEKLETEKQAAASLDKLESLFEEVGRNGGLSRAQQQERKETQNSAILLHMHNIGSYQTLTENAASLPLALSYTEEAIDSFKRGMQGLQAGRAEGRYSNPGYAGLFCKYAVNTVVVFQKKMVTAREELNTLVTKSLDEGNLFNTAIARMLVPYEKMPGVMSGFLKKHFDFTTQLHSIRLASRDIRPSDQAKLPESNFFLASVRALYAGMHLELAIFRNLMLLGIQRSSVSAEKGRNLAYQKLLTFWMRLTVEFVQSVESVLNNVAPSSEEDMGSMSEADTDMLTETLGVKVGDAQAQLRWLLEQGNQGGAAFAKLAECVRPIAGALDSIQAMLDLWPGQFRQLRALHERGTRPESSPAALLTGPPVTPAEIKSGKRKQKKNQGGSSKEAAAAPKNPVLSSRNKLVYADDGQLLRPKPAATHYSVGGSHYEQRNGQWFKAEESKPGNDDGLDDEDDMASQIAQIELDTSAADAVRRLSAYVANRQKRAATLQADAELPLAGWNRWRQQDVPFSLGTCFLNEGKNALKRALAVLDSLSGKLELSEHSISFEDQQSSVNNDREALRSRLQQLETERTDYAYISRSEESVRYLLDNVGNVSRVLYFERKPTRQWENDFVEGHQIAFAGKDYAPLHLHFNDNSAPLQAYRRGHLKVIDSQQPQRLLSRQTLDRLLTLS